MSEVVEPAGPHRPRAKGPFRAVSRYLDRTPLRIKLVAALLLLSATGLAALGFSGVVLIRGFLLDRVDKSLIVASGPPGPGGQSGRDFDFRQETERPRPPQTTAFFRQVTNADGTIHEETSTTGTVIRYVDLRPADNDTDGTQTAPKLPKMTTAEATRLAGKPFTVPATGAGSDWRVTVVPGTDGTTRTTAISLNEVTATVDQLALVEVLVSVAVLVVLAALGYAVVRSSLRRLVEVELTAEAIAAGDLSRRVPESDDRTEVGRLAGALNTMLTQIESAFRARQASESTARASEERMRRFVADASHELRTPLTSIRGFAELHRQGAVPDAAGVERVLRRIEDEAARMGLLVDDLLLLARLDQQRPLERRPVDLLALAADSVSGAQVVAPGHRIALKVDGGPESAPPVVLGDEARLRQVLGNLVSNALAHTPPGTAVTVRLATTDDTACLTVVDDGPGMAADHARRVFERFYRADSARGRDSGGAGLGLSIVAALVAAHGGTVQVSSAPGEGARFEVDTAAVPHSQLTPSQSPGCWEAGQRQRSHATLLPDPGVRLRPHHSPPTPGWPPDGRRPGPDRAAGHATTAWRSGPPTIVALIGSPPLADRARAVPAGRPPRRLRRAARRRDRGRRARAVPRHRRRRHRSAAPPSRYARDRADRAVRAGRDPDRGAGGRRGHLRPRRRDRAARRPPAGLPAPAPAEPLPGDSQLTPRSVPASQDSLAGMTQTLRRPAAPPS